MTFPITYSPEVAKARTEGTPIVALESTIITHGMPFPQNVDTAREVEAVVREGGATPATIAILNGQLHVGLTDAELNELAQAKDVAKVSRADMPVCIRRHHRCRDDDRGASGGHPRLCHRRHWRCAPRRRGNL